MSLAIGTSILSSIVSTVSAATTVLTAADGSALTRARNYATVQPSRQNATTTGGEADGHHWWMEHAELFEAARIEYGTLHPSLYNFHDHASEFIQPTVLRAIEECERAAAVGQPVDEAAVHALLTPAGAPNVWRLPLLTERFCEMLLEELRHYEASGIPLRRPNGMNRFGAILDQLGLEASMDYLSHRFVRPLGQLLFPWLIGATDADEHYAFVVKYKRGEDVALAEHADASVLTLNVNLGVRGFTGGELGFRGTRWVDAKPQQVAETLVDFAAFQPGDAILHLGGQYHSAKPIGVGERANLILWLHGPHGVVRFAPHDEADRLTAAQRWGAYEDDRRGHSFERAMSGASAGDAEDREDAGAHDEL